MPPSRSEEIFSEPGTPLPLRESEVTNDDAERCGESLPSGVIGLPEVLSSRGKPRKLASPARFDKR